MANPTQMVVGKGKLIAERLLKILRELIPPIPPKSLTNSPPSNGRPTKKLYLFPKRNELQIKPVMLILYL